jgi:flagellin
MVSINSNYAASFAANAAKQSQADLNSAMEKLSTGKRINFAKDDAAGSAIAMRIAAEVSGLAVASRNAADGQALIDTADGALKEVHSTLIRMRELAVQAQNGTLESSDVSALGVEFDALEAEITRISDSTTWGGKKILDGSLHTTGSGSAASATPLSIQLGASQAITHQISDMDAAALNLAASSVTVGAASTIARVDAAISTLSEERAKLGAVSNRLDSTISNLDQVAVNLSASQGRIEDTDFAQETGNLAKGQILQQAATAMVAQANASKSTVLTLLRG